MPVSRTRLSYLDWMRGLAALLMIQGHSFESWTRPADRLTERFGLTQFLGGLPAPIFQFLVGVSLAIVVTRMRERGESHTAIRWRVIRRGFGLLALAYAFRLEQFLVWYPAADWQGILRVDTLNCIAISTLAAGLILVELKNRATPASLTVVAAAISILTPFVFLVDSGPALLRSYLNGAGDWSAFTFFPWAGFTFAGAAAGLAIVKAQKDRTEAKEIERLGLTGVALAAGSYAIDAAGLAYGRFDYSVTSPQYFMLRAGWLLLILYSGFRWSNRRTAHRWSPLVTLGQASLLMYWVHIEIVYGRLTHAWSKLLPFGAVATQLVWLVPLMTALATLRVVGLQRSISACRRAVRKLFGPPLDPVPQQDSN